MSESLPPVATEETPAAVEEAVQEETAPAEGAAEETADQPWRRPLENLQYKQANFEKKLMSRLDQLMVARSEPAKEAARDDIADLLADGQALEQYVPGIGKTLEKIAAKLRETSEIPKLREEMQGRQDYESFMSSQSPAFREAYEKEVSETYADAKTEGQTLSRKDVQIHMGRWMRGWKEPNGTAPTKTASGRSVIPAPGARTNKSPDLSSVLASGHVPDGKGGYKPGNLLGI